MSSQEYQGLQKEVEKLREENKKLKEEITRTGEEKDAHWNDWLNEEFGDDLYPLNPPEPDDFVEKINLMKEENKELREVESLLQPFENTETFHMKVEEMKEKITCLESDSHNEVSQAEYDELEEQNNQYLKWFEEINDLVGADKGEPAVNSVSDYVEEHNITEFAFNIIKSENEINKKNILMYGLKK